MDFLKKNKISLNEGILFPNEDEMTRYGFISHMEAFMKKLLQGNLKAQPDEFLCKHGIDGPKAIEILTKRTSPDDENSAVLIRQERIVPMEQSDEDKMAGKTPKDKFCIKYRLPRKDYTKKMRNLYIDLFENYQTDNDLLDEEGEGGATNASASGQYATPLFGGKPIKRTIHITEEQAQAIKEAIEMDTAFGDFGYEAPIGDGKKNKNNNFFKDANDHSNMMEKSWNDYGKKRKGFQKKKIS